MVDSHPWDTLHTGVKAMVESAIRLTNTFLRQTVIRTPPLGGRPIEIRFVRLSVRQHFDSDTIT